MTESDWATSTDPQAMLAFLRERGPVSERKLRLFVVFCCRRIWHLLTDERSRAAVEVAERSVDESVAESVREAVTKAAHAAFIEAPFHRPALNWQAAWVAYSSSGPPGTYTPDSIIPLVMAHSLALRDPAQPGVLSSCTKQMEALALACTALGDIFGNPFHLVPFDPSWRTEAVVSLARGVYKERTWDRMPVLADALEDAGCDGTEMLEHCRGPNIHARGCWLIDEVLQKG